LQVRRPKKAGEQNGATMKRIFYFWLAAIVTTSAVSAIAAAQSQASSSLGDYARAVKKTQNPGKASPKVYDNDNLPTGSSLSVVGQTPESAADQEKDPGKDAGSLAKDGDKTTDGKTVGEKSAPQTKPDAAQVKPGQPVEERQKALAAWKAKLDEQKGEISLLSRELDVLQREYKLKASDFYSNTALRMQNASYFAADDAKFKKQISEKQQSLDGAKAKLTEMQDEARRSGAPDSAAE
jgi:hypothetical protein